MGERQSMVPFKFYRYAREEFLELEHYVNRMHARMIVDKESFIHVFLNMCDIFFKYVRCIKKGDRGQFR